MSQRDDFIAANAPMAPPCFLDRTQWVEYLKAADRDASAQTTTGPLDNSHSPATFNPAFDFCHDCTPEYRGEMLSCGKCKPMWLKQHEQQAAVTP